MAGTLLDRFRYLAAAVHPAPPLRRVSRRDAWRALIGYYGRERRSIARRLRVTPFDDQLVWVELGSFGVSWPAGIPIDRLLYALVELWVPGNPHYYFAPLTPIPPDAVVLDVGACEGAFALECLRHKGAREVWCFEPDSRMARGLELAADRNGVAGRLHAVRAVLGATSGTATFHETADPLTGAVAEGAPPAGHGSVHAVAQFALDDWAPGRLTRLDYIKIDAEGSDLAILEGARECLRRWRPRIAVTTYHQVAHCNQIYDFLAGLNLGYQLRAKGIVAFDGVPRPVMLHAACP